MKWILAIIASWTMVMSPVALGLEAEKISKSQMQNYLKTLGVDQKITYGEFYKKNKDLFPESIQKDLEPIITRFQNQVMPRFELVSSKNSKGEEVVTLRATSGKELINVQMLGQPELFAKFQNVNLSESDVADMDSMLVRIAASNDKYRQNYETNLLPLDEGYPALTKQTWSKMTQKERAAYIVNMRLMWNDSRLVLMMMDQMKKKNSGKTSSLESLEKWNLLLDLLQPSAEAQQGASRRAARPARPADSAGRAQLPSDGGSSAFIDGDNCLVAGYTTSYTRTKCDVKGIEKNYANDEFVKTANAECKTGSGANRGENFMSCNPYVYGTPGGSPVCINTKELSFQIATHHNGPCDMASPLGSTADFLNGKDERNAKRYENVNWTELENKYREEQKANPKLVEDYINGLMQYSKKKQIDFSKALSEDDFSEIVKIRDAFNNDIVKARESCRLATANKNNEKNFWGACDQLQRRYLFVAQFLEQKPGCPDGDKKINPDTLKCGCGTGRSEVTPGSKCGGAPVVGGQQGQCPSGTVEDRTGGDPVCVCENGAAGPGVSPEKAKEMFEKAGRDAAKLCPARPGQSASGDASTPIKKCGNPPDDKNCECPGGGQPTVVMTHENTGAEVLQCKKPATVPAAGTSSDCGFLCSLGKGLKVIGPWLGVAAVTAGLFYLMKPKKPKLNSAADRCPNGGIPPACFNQCTAPLVLKSNGTCGCPECIPGTTLTNAAQCLCSSTGSTPSTGQLTCWDGVTKVDNLANCPTRTYTCWDGSSVTNPLNCPEQPAPNSVPARQKK